MRRRFDSLPSEVPAFPENDEAPQETDNENKQKKG